MNDDHSGYLFISLRSRQIGKNLARGPWIFDMLRIKARIILWNDFGLGIVIF